MTPEQFDKFSYGLFGKCEALLTTKESDYAHGAEDRLVQFKLGAKRSGTTPERVLWFMREKHETALQMALDRLDAGLPLPPLEKWREWIGDTVCYSALLLALLEERMPELKPEIIAPVRIDAKKRKGKTKKNKRAKRI